MVYCGEMEQKKFRSTEEVDIVALSKGVDH